MIAAVAAIVAAASPALAPFDAELEPPDGTFAGTFHAPPAFHWRVRLPGPALNAATHAEHVRAALYGDSLLIGSAAGSALYRLSRRDGALMQVYPASSSVEAEPAVADGRVFFSDTAGTTWCYDIEGALVWRHDGTAPILVRPTVDAGVIYVTDVDDLAIALDADTGDLVWRFRAKRDLTRAAELALYAAPPAVPVDDVIVLGFSDGTLVGVARETGEQAWSRRVGEGRYPDLVGEPVAYGGDVFASGYFKPLVAMDAASRNVRWRVDAGSAHRVVIDDRGTVAVVYHPGTDGKLRAISALTGAERWVWDSKTSGALTAPVITDAGLVLGSSSGGLYLLDAGSGDEIWRVHEEQTLLGVSAQPVIGGRQLLFASNSGWLYAMVVPQERGPVSGPWP